MRWSLKGLLLVVCCIRVSRCLFTSWTFVMWLNVNLSCRKVKNLHMFSTMVSLHPLEETRRSHETQNREKIASSLEKCLHRSCPRQTSSRGDTGRRTLGHRPPSLIWCCSGDLGLLPMFFFSPLTLGWVGRGGEGRGLWGGGSNRGLQSWVHVRLRTNLYSWRY